jgi:hypothetical protein
MDLSAARTLASELMTQHGLAGWHFQFDNAKRRAGVCKHHQKVIGLSAPLTRLHPEGEVRDTLLHEIAHALVGPRAGHGPQWVAVAQRIGCSGDRCVSDDAPTVPGAWVGSCPRGHTVDRHKRPEAVLLCGLCGDRPALERVFDWRRHGRPVTMHPNYVAQLEALRSGTRITLLPVGSRGRVTVSGDYHGRVGTIVKRGRTNYHLRIAEGVLQVPIAWVEPAGA